MSALAPTARALILKAASFAALPFGAVLNLATGRDADRLAFVRAVRA